jgi:hypothetical protein
MARNRRTDDVPRLAPVLVTVILCAFFASLGVGYVWYKNQTYLLGRQITEREHRLAELQRQNKMRRDQLATLCSAPNLDAQVKKLNLGLIRPDLSQVIRLVDWPDFEPAPQAPPSNGLQALAPVMARRN